MVTLVLGGGKAIPKKMGKGDMGEMKAPPDEGDDEESEPTDAKAAKAEAFRALAKAIKLGDVEAGVEAMDAFHEAAGM